jgi:hypothetical protein
LCDRISLAQLVANAKLAAEIAANPPPGLRERDSSVPEAFPSTLPLPESSTRQKRQLRRGRGLIRTRMSAASGFRAPIR